MVKVQQPYSKPAATLLTKCFLPTAINAHLPERFRGPQPRKGHQSFTDGPEDDLDYKLNLDIRNYFVKQGDIAPTSSKDKWLATSTVPTHEELGETMAEVFSNKISGPYRNKSQYLKVQYSLQREDAVGSLRDAIHDFQNNPQTMDTQKFVIYDQVHFLGFTFARKGLAARIRFTTNRAGKKISWETSKRLTSGTLVALVRANDELSDFKGLITAVVAARPLAGVLAQEPEIDVYFSRPEDIRIDPQDEWLMIEAKQGYYEAYRHTLEALKMLSQEKFPFSDQICLLQPNTQPPEYIQQYSTMSLAAAAEPQQKEAYANVAVANEWPNVPQNTLDDSQWQAYREIITKSLSIIQGPPGTGKTFVSKIALQTLVENSKPGDPPIIIAAQTNHALDQLLRQVSVFEPNFIRLGGRSTSLEIKKRALFEIRRQERIKQIPGGLMGRSNSALDKKAKEMLEILEPIRSDIRHDKDPFSTERSPATDVLVSLDVLNAQQAKSLEDGAAQWISSSNKDEGPLHIWLDRALHPFVLRYSQDTFGFEAVEDEDLEFEQLRENEDSAGINDEEDMEMLKGPFTSINDKFTVASPTAVDLRKAERQLDSMNDLWKVPQYLRGPMYSIIRSRAIDAIQRKFVKAAKEYASLVTQSLIGKWEQDALYLSRARVIGLTTTGLSKYRALISALKPRICLIEEAAEVLEAPVTVACVESLQHLILVGDHQQLHGHCSVQELEGEPFFLAVSLFERLVNNGMPYKTLLRQRRMDPQFRRLLSSVYPTLTDHPVVLNRNIEPWGMGSLKLFFFKHNWAEERDASMSTFNDEEAKFIAGFYRYLQQNGVKEDRITVLTFYNGQRKRLLREIKRLMGGQAVYHNVKTVDSYQGEENDIVLLSLVRSNPEGKIGFLANINRVTVALSRAKYGFYLFGDASILTGGSTLWASVAKMMAGPPPRIAATLPVQCKNHGRTSLVENADQWDDIDTGGCTRPCEKKLVCGHPCPQRCHPSPHDGIQCTSACSKVLPCGHDCDKECFEDCDCPCEEFAAYKRGVRDSKINQDGPGQKKLGVQLGTVPPHSHG
ncbi:hypothetical protein PV10_05849 [Exophiala mesophila]|uniref:Helicase ATP-binding domain-containing protein n=1 Tax=Exophiala mesophila TaxID=212818 RepID=A0A0D1ZWV2_EXOME|nr:uncharacterized protein PV10_05849 [Exophiala mesophila]KIV91298.1 hypothetical protein PV10_05849 [Exophiala mesophila]